ncbi:uncharacterized protein LOC115796971 [Archocentrus centrarchus]|uniref:uncharacterized protein LOC115796971 n=1 Tax=Archocentrus centrarchus TaxID=63155 RepID=UPI0011E9C9DC|nr:uncharacterized protein LOC115796971 [Archocentrus centrarchus]
MSIKADMSDATSSRWLRLIFFGIVILSSSSADKMSKTAVPGEKVTLPCQALNVKTINGLEWSRLDMEREYVLMYRDEQSDPTHQHPSFKNRVDLQDREMKDGDVSLVLKDVTINDAGIYECRVVQGQHDTNRRKRANLDGDPICTFNLSVGPPPGRLGARVGLTVDWFGSVGLKVADMSGATSQFWLWLILIFSISIPSSSADQENITAESGQNITLPCRAPNNSDPKAVVEWSRTDLEPAYVLLYRDGHLDRHDQHPSFKNRVDLQDRLMKGGDVSLVLKDVTVNDTGTYECRVFRRGTKRKKRANVSGDPISIITLSVDPLGPTGGVRQDGGKEDGSVGLIVGLPVSLGLLLLLGVAVGFLIYRRCRNRQPPDDQQLDSRDHNLQACKETLLNELP